MKKIYIFLGILLVVLIGVNIYLCKDDFKTVTYDLSNETINGINIEIQKINNLGELQSKPKTIIIYSYDKYIGILPSEDTVNLFDDGLDTINKMAEIIVENEDIKSLDEALYECKTRIKSSIKSMEGEQ